MLYLEDFLEVVEGIPSEVREKTNEIRELDLNIHNTLEHLDEQVKIFFGNAKKMKSGEKAASYEKIRRQYYKLLEEADEKVAISSNLHESLERYVRRIDAEIEKFKCELEADSPGITEILEKKSLELDEPSRESQKENRSSYSKGSMSSLLSGTDWRHNPHAKKEDSELSLSTNLSLSPPVTSASLSYTLGHIGAGSNAIAAAASQAIAATQQMRHGRRTASLAASFDAVSQGVLPADLSIGSELAHAAKAAIAASSLSQESGYRKHCMEYTR
ncbi:Inhibitor of growth protein 3 [Armadillidium nasatum]|uniref:Inhibitor of growth protein 3 n=1 Tax=Armadillidium nasatum TaxID=96803 RepID=A0A5N5TMM3_9CRUS|nr:Inhibitor of growth protein 3 [Armadillidium nasatum]